MGNHNKSNEQSTFSIWGTCVVQPRQSRFSADRTQKKESNPKKEMNRLKKLSNDSASIYTVNQISKPALNNIRVIKRDGRTENFDPQKLKKSILKAGTNPRNANLVTKRVISRLSDKKEISSKKLSNMTARSLSKVDNVASLKYTSFRDQKKRKTITPESSTKTSETAQKTAEMSQDQPKQGLLSDLAESVINPLLFGNTERNSLFPSPEFDSGWIPLAPGEKKELTPRLGDLENAFVYVVGRVNNGGIWRYHQQNFGIDDFNWGFYQEFRTKGMTWQIWGDEYRGDKIEILRAKEDEAWEQVRVRIWLLPPAKYEAFKS